MANNGTIYLNEAASTMEEYANIELNRFQVWKPISVLRATPVPGVSNLKV